MEENHPFLNATLEECSAAMIDQIWADGWRNFGTYFFRNQLDFLDEGSKWVNIVPLRINIEKFSFKKNQSKLLQKTNHQLIIKYEKVDITPYVEHLFFKHTERFKRNIPDSIYNFLGENPGEKPMPMLQCAVYDLEQKLIAVSYFGIGEESISSIYALFDTDFSSLRLGLLTLLYEIIFAQQQQKKYVYLGYAYDVPSFYDYKKNFNGLEAYDFNGNWQDYPADNI